MIYCIRSDKENKFLVTDIDPFVCARAVFNATTRFHDLSHVAEWSDPDIDAAFDEVWSLLLVGLSPRNVPL
jgi:Tetracyclin repressor-like, C-terminal domain